LQASQDMGHGDSDGSEEIDRNSQDDELEKEFENFLGGREMSKISDSNEETKERESS